MPLRPSTRASHGVSLPLAQVRTATRTAVCYEALPLRGVRTGLCVMAQREPRSGARIQFSQLHVRIAKTKVLTLERVAPMAALLEEMNMPQYQGRFDELGIDTLDALEEMPKDVIRRLLCNSAEQDGVGMTEGDAGKFTRALKAKLLLAKESELSSNLLDLMQEQSTMMGERKAVTPEDKKQQEKIAKKNRTTGLNSSEAAAWFGAEGGV